MSDDGPPLPSASPAVVIGAGPAGLAAAAALRQEGVTAVVVDRAAEIGSAWARHYDRLHLHTARRLSSLPGMVIPRAHGRWVARDDFRAYLQTYASFSALDVRLGVTVLSVDQAPDGGWLVRCDEGTITTPLVIIATGYNSEPRVPHWPGLRDYTGRVIHSSEYRNPSALGAASVLVVGPGNSGAEIAADVADAGLRVWLSVRTPPNIVRRQVAGIPSQVLVLSISPLPLWARDRISGLIQRVTVGDLGPYGLPASPRGIATQTERDDVTPTIDVGLVRAVRNRRVEIVAAVESFGRESVRLGDGSELRPDLVIAATGYRRNLEGLVGHLRVLAPGGRPTINGAQQAPGLDGLYFLGYSNPLTGNLRQLGIDARAIARAVGRARRR